MISNNNEKDQLNYVDLNLNKKEDYYFSLFDLLNAFYKRKYILFSTFSIVFIFIFGFAYIFQDNYKVQLKVNIMQERQDVLPGNPYSNEIGELFFLSGSYISNKNDIQEAITKKIDQLDLNKVFFEENQLNNTGFFFTETKQPKIEIENLKSHKERKGKVATIFRLKKDIVGDEHDTNKAISMNTLKQRNNFLVMRK